MKVKRYKHDSLVSYALGATLTYELLACKPELATRVLISSSTERSDGILRVLNLCKQNNIPIEENDKAFNILSPKGNCYVIGEFKKSEARLCDGNHIVLVNPSDAGNLGTIIRTATGFGIKNIAIIRKAVDFYDPRTIRASMGAAFHVNVQYFDTFDDYMDRFDKNNRYAFMLTASKPLTDINVKEPYSLIFGNEATGLDDKFSTICDSVRIVHSNEIDSLNLPMAAGIAMFYFTKE